MKKPRTEQADRARYLMSTPRRLVVAAGMALSAVVLCACLTACGGGADGAKVSRGTKRSSTNPNAQTKAGIEEREEARAVQREAISQLAPPAKIAASTVLARVAGEPITFAKVSHQMKTDSFPTPLPDPPAYTGCTALLKAQAAKPAEAARQSRLPGVGVLRYGESKPQLREACETAYKYVLQSALSTLIHARWLLGEATEEGLRVSDAAVRHELALSKGSFQTVAQFEEYLRHSGQSLADMRSQIRLSKVVDALSHEIEKRLQPPTTAEVTAYYEVHRGKYTIPEGRRVRILRTTAQASARRARQQIEAGRSFASVVAGLSGIAQPISARKGEVADLAPGYYQEKNLNDTIFSAQLHKLYGPVQVVAAHRTFAPESGSGSYVFEVRGIVPARTIPLSRVERAIAAELTRTRREGKLRSAVAAFKAKWRTRTVCTPGFVVKNCKQYKASPRGEVGDPFTL